MLKNTQPNAHGIRFHPDLIRGTALGQEIKNYSFFSYETREALHLSEEERETVMDCLHKIETELKHSIDKHSRRLICANIGLLLDYCMRFYERQFTTREQVNKDIIVRFERLLDDYFDSDGPLREGLPTVKYFADKVFLSANYFGDMIRKQTGQTASEYIQNKLIERTKALVGIPFPQVDDTTCLRFPADDSDRFAVVVFKLAVNFSHNALALRLKTPTTPRARLWLHATHFPHTMRSYRNDEVPYTGIPRSCGRRLFTVTLFMR